MIGIGTLLLIAVLFSAYRRNAWGVAFLGMALGLVIAGTKGPLASGINATLAAVEALLNAIGKLI